MSKQLKLDVEEKNVKNQKKIIFGLILLSLSIFLFLSFNSFWFNWDNDQDKIKAIWDYNNVNNIRIIYKINF